MFLRAIALIFFLSALGFTGSVLAQTAKPAAQSAEIEKDPCADVPSFGDRGRCYDAWVAEATEAVDNVFGQLIGDKGKELGVNSSERTALRRYYQAYDRDMAVRCRRLEYHCKRSAATEAYLNFIKFARSKIEENEKLDKTRKRTKPYPNLEKILKQRKA